MWPVRGAPVIHSNTLYYAAGVWPFQGTFITAVDPVDGRTRWVNSGSGSTWTEQPHRAYAFAGVAPQGYLAANNDVLLVAGGRSVPAAYDPANGALLYYKLLDPFPKRNGGYGVTIGANMFFNGTAAYARSAYRFSTTAADTDMIVGVRPALAVTK